MALTIVETREIPEFAREMQENVARLGPSVATSSSTREGEPVAWGVAVEEPEHVLVFAVAKRDPAVVVAMRVKGHPLAAMAMARSLVHRSGKRLAEARQQRDEAALVPAHFGDLQEVPKEVSAPQYVVGETRAFGPALPSVMMAVGCTWSDMALDPDARASAVRARAKDGVTGDALAPLDRALEGISRSLRKAKEPLSSNAAWALQALIPGHREEVRALLSELVLLEKLSEERRELLGALVDGLNAAALEDAEKAPADGGPRVVVCQLRLPPAKGAPGRVVVAYFYSAAHRSRSTLEARHPEAPLPASVERAGFAHLDHVFEKHEVVVREALAARDEVTLQRGFHADVGFDDARASFAADGFVPIALVLDA